jgi:acyl-CoA dehydrogenase
MQATAVPFPMTAGAPDGALSPHEAEIRDAVARLCAPFDDAYWLAKDRDGGFPEDFYRAFA